MIPAGVGTLLATFGICSSVPPTPPSPSAAETSQSFLQGIKSVSLFWPLSKICRDMFNYVIKVIWLPIVRTYFMICLSGLCTDFLSQSLYYSQMFKIKAYWILMLCFGVGVGLFTALTTLLEQILCPRGYSDVSTMSWIKPQNITSLELHVVVLTTVINWILQLLNSKQIHVSVSG